jgi:hypothetical protein
MSSSSHGLKVSPPLLRASKARSSARRSQTFRPSICTGLGILPSPTISSNFPTEIPMYCAAASRCNPRGGRFTGRASYLGMDQGSVAASINFASSRSLRAVPLERYWHQSSVSRLSTASQRTCSQHLLGSLGTIPASQSRRCRPLIAKTRLYTMASRSDFISPLMILFLTVLRSVMKSDPQTKSVALLGSYRHLVLVGNRRKRISARPTGFDDRLTALSRRLLAIDEHAPMRRSRWNNISAMPLANQHTPRA